MTFCFFFLPNSKVVFLECNSLTCFLKKVYSSKVLFQANVAARKIQSTLCFISHNRVLFTTQACILLYKLKKWQYQRILTEHKSLLTHFHFGIRYSIFSDVLTLFISIGVVVYTNNSSTSCCLNENGKAVPFILSNVHNNVLDEASISI